MKAAGLGVALSIGRASAAPASSRVAHRVREAVERVMAQYRIAGMSIATTHNGVRAFHNFGVLSKETGQKVTHKTLFEIGSVSKTFTATLASYGQASGRLRWSDSPATFLPTLQSADIAKVDLLSLATHTAGGFPLQLPDSVDDMNQLLAYYRAWRPQYAQGSARTYSNPGTGLLGLVAAKAWERPFNEAMEGVLLPALGLHDTFVRVPRGEVKRYAMGYNANDAPVHVSPAMLADEAYGVKTCSRDLIRFVELNIDPSSLSPELERAVRATHTGYFKLRSCAMVQALVWEQYEGSVSLAELVDGNSARVAYETQAVDRIDPPHQPGMASWVNKTGATNGFGAYVAWQPHERAGVVILANRNFPNEARVRLASHLLEAG